MELPYPRRPNRVNNQRRTFGTTQIPGKRHLNPGFIMTPPLEIGQKRPRSDELRVLSAIDATQVDLPALSALVAANTNPPIGLVGVLRGDVDGSWAPLNV
jgi:hypothetical protein